MFFDDEDTPPEEEPRACLHCLIWETIRAWGGDVLQPREYRGALQAFALILADVVVQSQKNGVTQDQIVTVFNGMFNEAMTSYKTNPPTTHEDNGDPDLSPDRVIN